VLDNTSKANYRQPLGGKGEEEKCGYKRKHTEDIILETK
jgi:hypothetical protein